MCGKNGFRSFGIAWTMGSPPRVREKHIVSIEVDTSCRITPACAGKTATRDGVNVSVRDHPRVCGKNPLSVALVTVTPGSPPRVREKLRHTSSVDFVFGITPACAGKTILDKVYLHLDWDHPRVCGKNRHWIRELEPQHWITPACAGKTTVIALFTRFIFACST